MRAKIDFSNGKFDFVFLLCSMPALTGFFFSFFDVFVVFICIFRVLSGARIDKNGISFLLFVLLVIVISGLLNSDSFDVAKYLSLGFLLFVLFSVHQLFIDGFFTAEGALSYWMAGLFFNFLVLIAQQLNPGIEIFNDNSLKSYPVPGLDIIRGQGLLYNPNSLAAYSLICFLYFMSVNKVFMVAISLISAFLTFSKTFFLAPIIYMLYFVFNFRLKLFVISLIVFIFAFYFSSDFVLSYFDHRITNADSFDSRLNIVDLYFDYDYTLQQIIFGHGASSDNSDFGRIHNKFISSLYQFGLLGLLAFLFFYCAILWRIIANPSGYRFKPFVLLATLLTIALAMVSSITFFSFDYVIIILLMAYGKRKF